jgi:hypothetical protein
MQSIALAQDWPNDEYEKLFREALAAGAGNCETYFAHVWRYASKGEPGEWERVSEELSAQTDCGKGLEFYTRMASWVSPQYKNIFAESQIQWAKMRQGFHDMEKRYPNSVYNLNNFCRFACLAHDKTTARELFERIGTRWNKRLWKRFGLFQTWKAWADPASPPVILDPMRKLERRGDARARAAAFIGTGKLVAIGYDDGVVILWDVTAGTPAVWLPTLERKVEDLAVSPDGKSIALALGETEAQPGGVLKVLSLQSPYVEMQRVSDWKKSVFSARYSPDGKLLVGMGGQRNKSGEARVVELTTNEVRPVPWPSHEHNLVAAAFSPDGRQLAVNCEGDISVWDFQLGKLVYDKKNTLPISPRTVAFAPDGLKAAAGCGGEDSDETGVVAVWDAKDWQKPPTRFAVPGNGIFTVTFSPDSKNLVGAGLDEAVYFWNVESGVRFATLLPMHGAIRSVAFAPDGHTVAVAADHGMSIWRAPGKSEKGQ